MRLLPIAPIKRYLLYIMPLIRRVQSSKTTPDKRFSWNGFSFCFKIQTAYCVASHLCKRPICQARLTLTHGNRSLRSVVRPRCGSLPVSRRTPLKIELSFRTMALTDSTKTIMLRHFETPTAKECEIPLFLSLFLSLIYANRHGSRRRQSNTSAYRIEMTNILTHQNS